jgi:TIR domain
MPKVFLSHSSADKPFVRMFSADLEAAGFEVWLDEAKLKIGDSLLPELAAAIDSTDFFLAFISENSIRSNWVRKEVALAATKEIKGASVKVLPLLLDNGDVPFLLIDKVHANFKRPEHYDSEFQRLLDCIEPRSLPKNGYSFYCLTVGATRKDRLVQAAKDSQMRDWIIDYLISELDMRQRETERYWVYIALGEIGGEKAEVAIQKGLSDPPSFARSGAEKAWEVLRHSISQSTQTNGS